MEGGRLCYILLVNRFFDSWLTFFQLLSYTFDSSYLLGGIQLKTLLLTEEIL